MMTLSGLLLAACVQGTSRDEATTDRALSAFEQRQSAVDLKRCSATNGKNYKALRRCVDERAAARQAQLENLREALRKRRLRTSQTSCSNPVTGASETCQEI